MSVAFYLDEHIHSAVTVALRRRGVDVVTAQEDGYGSTSDPEVLDRARDLDRVVFTQDDDFLREGVRRQRAGEGFAGILYAHQQNISIRECIEQLETIAYCCDIEEFRSRVLHLPL